MKASLNVLFYGCDESACSDVKTHLSKNGFLLDFREIRMVTDILRSDRQAQADLLISDASQLDELAYLELLEMKEAVPDLFILFIKDKQRRYTHPLRILHLGDEFIYRHEIHDIAIVVQNLLKSRLQSTLSSEAVLSADLRNFLDSLDRRTAIIDNEGTFIFINRAWKEYAAQHRFNATLEGENISTSSDFGCGLATTDIEHLETVFESIVRRKQDNGNFVFDFDGHSYKIQLDRYEGPAAAGCILSIDDITALKKAEQELFSWQQKFEVIVNSLDDFIYTVDSEGTCNGVYGRGLYEKNINRDQIEGKTAQEIFGPSIEEAYQRAHQQAMAGKTVSFEWSGQTENGYRYYYHTLSPQSDVHQKVTGLVGVARDITEKKILQSQLIQTQRMEGIGQLASGIAHDFNNILNVITGYADLLLMENGGPNKRHDKIAEILKAGRRGTDLTRQLLAFARKEKIEPRVFDITEVLQGIQKILQRVIGEDINLTFHNDKSDVFIKADPGQIEQILINMAANARDAIHQKSTWNVEEPNIHIATQVELDCKNTTNANFSLNGGPYLVLSITDNGCGMDREICQKIFEPFFTTKPQEKGTGLGLATVYGILKQNKAGISVYSEPGIGTTFKIYWPLAEEWVSHVIGAGDEPVFEKGNESILLVEDDENVRAFSAMALSSFGYQVVEARDGHEALQLLNTQKPDIDLIISDVVMPNMGGVQLLHTLQGQGISKPVILTSGYSGGAPLSEVRSEHVEFLQKPYSMQALSEKVREVIDATAEVDK